MTGRLQEDDVYGKYRKTMHMTWFHLTEVETEGTWHEN